MGEALGVGTVMIDGYAQIVVELLRREPHLVLDDWDQIIRCSVSAPSGCLKVSTVPECEIKPAIRLPVGSYQVAVCWGNVKFMHERLKTLDDSHNFWFAKPTLGEIRDRYQVFLWPAPLASISVTKRLKGPMTW